MRCEWFGNFAVRDRGSVLDFHHNANVPDAATTNEIQNARALLSHVAMSYLSVETNSNGETTGGDDTSSGPLDKSSKTATSSQSAQPLARKSSLLSQALSFKSQNSSTMAIAAPQPRVMLESEIDRWYRFEGGKGDEQDPLEWWKTYGGSFPVLSRLARDFLAIPATSVSVERTFSQSRHICSDLRSSMKAETIREALLSKAWIRSGLFDVEPEDLEGKKGVSLDRLNGKR